MPIRCFIAVEIQDDTVISKIREIQNFLASTDADVKLVEPENIHLTLKFLGDVDESRLEYVKNIVKDENVEPFVMNLHGIGVFPNLRRPRIIWVGISNGVESLAGIFLKLESILFKQGFPKENRVFNPHITIGRVRSNRNLNLFGKTISEYANTPFGEIVVNSIILKKSVLSSRGPIYSNLAVSSKI